MQRGRPLTLEASIELPSANDDPSDLQLHQLNGFIQQVNLFRPFDNSLVALWNKTKERDENLGFLEKQLPEVLPPYLNAQQAQLSEMQINQQWAKNTVWQLGVASGNGNESGMGYSYHPVDITRDLLPMVTALPGNLGFNGLGLVEKLLSITCSLTEVLAMQPASRDPYAMGPQQHLHQILNVLTVIRSGDLRFLPLLLSKVNHVLPKLTNPMLQNAPENAVCNMDIFDGFGNAGMAQPPVFPTEEYDNKYAISRVDDLDSSSPNGGPQSSNELSSPFDSTPSIMSPGVDLPHGLQTDFTTMADIAMSPLSHAPPQSIPTSGAMGSQQSQHAQHSPMAPFPGLASQMHGMNGNLNPPPNIGMPSQMHLGQAMSGVIGNGMSVGLGQPLNSNSIISRPPQPQRTSSFAVGPPIRTIGDFHALQRANSDIGSMNSMGMTSMGTELDFNTLPR